MASKGMGEGSAGPAYYQKNHMNKQYKMFDYIVLGDSWPSGWLVHKR